MSARELIVIGANQREAECFPEWQSKLFEAENFDPKSKDLSCRVLILVRPDKAILDLAKQIWQKEPGPVKIVATSEAIVDLDDYLVISDLEILKPNFKNLLGGLLRSKREQDAHNMLARVCHDMRSPMSVIKMACQLTQLHGGNEERRNRYLAMVEDSTSVIQTLVGDILDFSQINSKDVSLNLSSFNLHDLFESVVNSSTLLAEDKGLELRFSLHPETPQMVKGDPGRIKQILTNLTSNAIKFTSSGYVEIKAAPHAHGCAFEVIDTGIGIPEGAQKKIFQPYQQADATIVSRFGGTGLGLSICNLLVKRMGGEMDLWSTHGEGSCFSFYLSLESVESESTAAQPVTIKGRKVWMMGHSPNDLCLAKARKLGLPWESFQRSYTLAKRANEENPDILIFCLDNGGFAKLEEIISKFKDPGPKIVVTTSAGQRGDAARCKALGVRGYLAMPFGFGELEQLLPIVISDDSNELITRHTVRERKISSSPSEDSSNGKSQDLQLPIKSVSAHLAGSAQQKN